MADVKLPKVVGKFRLREKCGTHTEISEGGVWFVQPNQVFEGRSQLDARFPEKFEKVSDAKKVTAVFIANDPNGQQKSLADPEVADKIAQAPTPTADGPELDKSEVEDTFKTYQEMTLQELKAQSQEEGLDLEGARSKADILEVFKRHLGLAEDEGDE